MHEICPNYDKWVIPWTEREGIDKYDLCIIQGQIAIRRALEYFHKEENQYGYSISHRSLRRLLEEFGMTDKEMMIIG